MTDHRCAIKNSFNLRTDSSIPPKFSRATTTNLYTPQEKKSRERSRSIKTSSSKTFQHTIIQRRWRYIVDFFQISFLLEWRQTQCLIVKEQRTERRIPLRTVLSRFCFSFNRPPTKDPFDRGNKHKISESFFIRYFLRDASQSHLEKEPEKKKTFSYVRVSHKFPTRNRTMREEEKTFYSVWLILWLFSRSLLLPETKFQLMLCHRKVEKVFFINIKCFEYRFIVL